MSWNVNVNIWHMWTCTAVVWSLPLSFRGLSQIIQSSSCSTSLESQLVQEAPVSLPPLPLGRWGCVPLPETIWMTELLIFRLEISPKMFSSSQMLGIKAGFSWYWLVKSFLILFCLKYDLFTPKQILKIWEDRTPHNILGATSVLL